MSLYLVDTNVFLRFVLQDVAKQAKEATDLMKKASEGLVDLYILPEIIFEIDYVLRKVYKLSKDSVCEAIDVILKNGCINVLYGDKSVLVRTIEKYKTVNIDIADIYMFVSSVENNMSIFSFDKDFSKLR